MKRGLGQDKDNDLLKDFEITVKDGGTKCTVHGTKKWFKSINELLWYYGKKPLHPSVQSLGTFCVSPRHKDMAKGDLTVSDLTSIPHAEAEEKLMAFQEEYKIKLTDLQEQLEEERNQRCVILWPNINTMQLNQLIIELNYVPHFLL